MNSHLQEVRISEQAYRQVNLDAARAVARQRFCPEQREVMRVRCIDHLEETEQEYGHQLWFFEGHGVDPSEGSSCVYGVVEYQVEYGCTELVENRVFQTTQERERFRSLYECEVIKVDWRGIVLKLLAAGLMAIIFFLAYTRLIQSL